MYAVRMTDTVIYAFGSEIFRGVVPERFEGDPDDIGLGEMNRQLAGRLLALHAEAGGAVGRRAVRAWQSDVDFGLCGLPAVERLNLAVRMALAEVEGCYFGAGVDLSGASVSGQMWGNVYLRGGFAEEHVHGEWDWSGIYVVDPGDPPGPPPGPGDPEGSEAREAASSGEIRFLRPHAWAGPRRRQGRHRAVAEDIRIRPVAGLLLLFAPDQWHAVSRYVGRRPRITVGLNLTVDGPVRIGGAGGGPGAAARGPGAGGR